MTNTQKLKDVLSELESLGNGKVRLQYAKRGAGDNQFGVKLGDIRKIAARIKTDPLLAEDLWETGNIDARLLAILLFDPKKLSFKRVDELVRSCTFVQVADWLLSYAIKKHPDNEELRQTWMEDSHPWAARMGWGLTSDRISKNPEGLDISKLLDRIESEMGISQPEVQWTMNFTLAAIGIHFPQYRDRAITIGETLGIYRDYPVSKGCTSPFAPIWINEMVRREG